MWGFTDDYYSRIFLDMSDLIIILILAFIGSILALVGGVVFLLKKSWATWLSYYSIPFAAGVLLVVSIVGLLPEALHAVGEKTFLIVLVTFLAAHFFERFFFGVHSHTEGGTHDIHHQASVPIIIFGDTIHNFIDGVAIAASYFINPSLGLITTIATFLHEVPHEIADFGVLLKSGWGRMKVFWVNVFSASTTILGALFVYFFHSEGIIGILLAVSAGLFLYLGASNFLPHVHEEDIPRGKAAIALLAGVLLMFFVIKTLPHSNSEEEVNGHEDEAALILDRFLI